MDDVSDFLPMKPVDFYVLVVLLEGPTHGYGIVQDVERRTDGEIRLVPGNLYPVLHRLEEKGLLEEGEPPADASDHKQRKYYAITEGGRRVAAAEARRLRELVTAPAVEALLDGLADAR